MTDERRADQSEVISFDDAERLLAGVAPGLDDSPSLASLHQILAATRCAGENHELADAATVVAAFRAARSPIRKTSRRHVAPLNSITHRTIAIIGIATGASLGAAFATGAVDNPFEAPPRVDEPGTTWHPIEPIEPPTTSREPNSVATSPAIAPDVNSSLHTDPASSGTATTRPPDADEIGRENGVHPSATSPGQTGISPSATAPGQTGHTPSVTAPGQVGDSPSATAPGQTGDSPSATAPGQAEQRPSATAPGQTGKRNGP